MRTRFSISRSNLLLVLLALAYVATTVFQAHLQRDAIAPGMLAQVQFALSVTMVTLGGTGGFWTAVVLNVSQILLVSAIVLLEAYLPALPGIALSAITLLLCALLRRTFQHLNDRIVETNVQSKALETNAAQLDFLAYHDQLTGLPNRRGFTRVLTALCGDATHHDKTFALLLLDLDHFSNINDVLGNSAGDLVLQAVAEKLRAIRDPSDFLARWGGDSFALIVNRGLTDRELYHLAQQYKGQLGEVAYRVQSILKLSASIGMAFYPRDSTDAMELVDFAQTAIRKAKEGGRNDIRLFTGSMKAELYRRFSIEQQMMSALENGELTLVFQPQYRINTHSLRGFEALLRWRSPTLGPVESGLLIALAENNGLINTWGRWVMEEACRQFSALQPSLPEGARLALNVSPRQVMHRDFMLDVQSTLQHAGVSPRLIELEITESLFIADVEAALETLHRVRALGVHIALDDFGTGYSSLNLLRRMPIELLKIDRAFIRDLAQDPRAAQVVESLTHLAHRLDMEVIAEGVETEEQLSLVSRCGCDSLQGYLWGKPAPLGNWLPEMAADTPAQAE